MAVVAVSQRAATRLLMLPKKKKKSPCRPFTRPLSCQRRGTARGTVSEGSPVVSRVLRCS
jgi:hypothetical protein